MRIEVLKCKDCGWLVISVDDVRQTTDGPSGHGGSKCSGSWRVLAIANYPLAAHSPAVVSEEEERP